MASYTCRAIRPQSVPLTGPPRCSASRSRVVVAAAPGGGTGAFKSSRLEHMDTVSVHKETLPLHKYRDLDLAETELSNYCSILPPEAETDKCWQAYSFLEQKREKAKAGCDALNQKDCEELDTLNDMAHQLLSTGSMDDVVATFSTLARVEEHRAARAAKQAATTSLHADPEADPVRIMFQKMDTNGDGRISVAEFRQVMSMMGDELDGATVSMMLDALDVHGPFINEQQFRDIVEAEQLNSKSAINNMWRHPHRGPIRS